MKPLVSILVPAFNAERWIHEALTSAVSQTWTRKEIIVVDDGSTDRTLAVARTFQSGILKVVTQPHQNAAAARNCALSHSQGGYIQWLDADDVLARDKVEWQLSTGDASADSRVLLSSAWGSFMYRRSRARFVPTALWQDLAPAEWLSLKMHENVFMQTATWLVSRGLTVAAGPWDTRLSVDDDGEYICRVLRHSEGVKFVPEARVLYRFSNGNSLSHIGRSHDKMESQFLSMQLHIAHLRSLQDDAATRAVCVRYLENSLDYFVADRPDLVRQATSIARDLGKELRTPDLRWKYAVIGALAGKRIGRRAQSVFPRIRWALAGLWDRAMVPFEVSGSPRTVVLRSSRRDEGLAAVNPSSDSERFDGRRP